MILLATTFAFAADGPPRDDASCDALAAWFSARTLPAADLAPTRWWLEDPPCEPAHDIIGAAPPRARDVSCTLAGRRDGPQTMFSEEGEVLLETHWTRGEEVGPRLEWDRDSKRLLHVTPMAKGVRTGEVVAFPAAGGVTLTTFARGLKNGPAFEIDAAGALARVEHWRDDVRHGRSCTWKDGAVDTDQLYRLGSVAR